jgi:carbon-monoxide dehydrogenase large subunit
VVHESGGIGVAGAPATALAWAELAAAGNDPARRPMNWEFGLQASLDFEQAGGTFPFGAHLAVVEIDSETGRVELLRHVTVDDCGNMVNPLLVYGQLHGGIANGLAQALFEGIVYDDDGNPLTANLMDYAMPSAAEFPSFEVNNTVTPTHLNPLGAKGVGESGTLGATPAVHNAVVDALSHLGVRDVVMPLSAQRVWQTIRQTR